MEMIGELPIQGQSHGQNQHTDDVIKPSDQLFFDKMKLQREFHLSDVLMFYFFESGCRICGKRLPLLCRNLF